MTRPLKIDHVAVAGKSLDELQRAFAAVGLPSEYGGVHANGVTHMALVPFPAGSYIELISTLEPVATAPHWAQHVAANGGPCGWAVQADDVASEVRRIAALGIPVQGPVRSSRYRPDGRVAEWDLAFPGVGEPGATLPFLIQDLTPRELRMPADPSTLGCGGTIPGACLTDVGAVVVGANDLDAAVGLFRLVYGWPAPVIEHDAAFGATLAAFVGTPVILAAPLPRAGWLSHRLGRFGWCPCAYLMATRSIRTARERFDLSPTARWFGRAVSWLDPLKLNGVRLGVMETAEAGATGSGRA